MNTFDSSYTLKGRNRAVSNIGGQERQTISVVDILSEGPIYGLVEGQSSVYLNDDRAAPLGQAAIYASTSNLRVSLTNGSKTVTVLYGGSTPIIDASNGDKYLIVRGGYGATVADASNGNSGDGNGNITADLVIANTAPTFFQDYMLSSPSGVDTHVPVRLSAISYAAGYGLTDSGFGEGYLISRSDNRNAVFMPGSGTPAGLWIPDGHYSVSVDRIVKIQSISGTTVTLVENWTGVTSDYSFDVSGAIVANADAIDQAAISNYEGVTTQFRVGTLAQTPFAGEGGVGSTAISHTPANTGAFEQTTGFGGSQAAKELIGSSASGFNLTSSQIQEADEARITIGYSSGHYAVSGKGNDKTTYTTYQSTLAIKKIGAADFESPIVLQENLIHSGMRKNAVSWVQVIDLNKYRPFSDFKVTISRKTDHQGDGYKSATVRKDDWQNVTSSSITNVTTVLKEILTHPYTAMSKVTFDTKQFQGMPTRSYHVRGLKVQVPSNYVTREESGGAANYNRSVTTTDIEATYQDWDGGFRQDPLYTNNPAWVFYDILTNNRYGLGDFLLANDIDKYSLYKIARYCDELVDDGYGGLEPRFVANLYFTKQADAYKVLKDIATVFRAMLYFLGGQVVPVIDAPGGPVYNFTKGNVIEGKFSYESTGSKTRINQVIVSWLNPEANYKLEPLIVEDRVNIINTSAIISQTAMAMGATSEGQAMRYGRWKLWTAANQREVVSFATSLNASFLIPGDIINVQDADRYAVRYSGRISNSGTTPSTTSIPLDSPVTLVAGSVYDLSIIFVEPGAYAGSSFSIGANDYEIGDLVPQAYIDDNANGTYTLQDIDTEAKAINAKTTAAGTEALILSWADTTRVETRTVTSSLSGSQSTLTVPTAFEATPTAESIWVLTETTAAGATVLGSAKQYKILALAEDSKANYSITAAEHYNEKFEAVDKDFTTFVADTVYPTVTSTETVPPVRDVFATSWSNAEYTGEELAIQWTPPSNTGLVTGLYEHLKGFEIVHEFPDIESPIRINNPNKTYKLFPGIPDGSYRIAVRAINTLNNVSEPTIIYVEVSDKFGEIHPRLPDGVPSTGSMSCSVEILSTGLFRTVDSSYVFKHPSILGATTRNTSATTSYHQQDCSGLPVITKTTQSFVSEFILEHTYILLDADSADRFKLLKYYKPTTTGTAFWYDTGTGGGTSKFGSALTGTFSKAADSSKITGSGTAFTSQIQTGDVLKLGSDEVRVAYISSDTVLYLARATGTVHSGVQGFIPNIRIDYINDCFIGKIYKTSAGYTLEPSVQLDSSLKPASSVVQDGTVTTTQIADQTILAANIDQTASGGGFGELVADVGTFTTVDTAVLNADSVIAREVQVFPNGGTAPTISGTTLTGAGIDLKQDGDLYVGNFSTNKYMFWDQSTGVMTFRGTLNAGDLTAGSIDADRITTRSLTADKIVANSLTAAEIGVGALTAGTIAADAITTDKIAANAITTTEIAAGAVTASEITVANLASINADIGAITAGTIRGNTMPDADAAPAGSETGAFLDMTGGKMVFGDASKYILWDGSDLKISGVNIVASQFSGSGFATEGYVTTAISNLVDGADASLDTLSEIATALGNDAALNTTLTNSIATKLPKAGGAMTGAITTNSTFDGRDVATDGTKLDGITAGATNTAAPYYTSAIAVGDGGLTTNDFTSADHTKLNGIATSANNYTHPANHAISVITGLQTALDGKIDDSQVLTNVPSGAVFTDTNTTYSVGDGGLSQINFTSADNTKLDGIATSANYITNNSQLTNGAGYVTNADDGDAATFGGVLPSGYVKTDHVQALSSAANAMTASGSTITLTRGDASTDTVTLPNTTYSVGDGGLTTNNFTDADHTKLNSVATSANNYTHPTNHAISVITGLQTALDNKVDDTQVLTNVPSGAVFTDTNTTYSVGDGGLTTNDFTSADHTKLNGIATSANNYSHPANHAISVITGLQTALDGKIDDSQVLTNVPSGAVFTDTVYTHPDEGVDMGAALTGANVISDVTVNAKGHVTGFASRAMTLSHLGYPGTGTVTNGATTLSTGDQIYDFVIGLGYVTSDTTYTAGTGLTLVGTEFRNTATDTNYYLNGITKSSNTLTFAVNGATNQTYTFGSNAFNSTAFTTNTGTVTSVAASTGLVLSGTGTVNPTLALTGNALALHNADSSGTGSLDLELLKADTIIADHITTNTIKSTHLEISADSGANRIEMDGSNNVIKVYADSVLRVKIGNLA